MIPLQYSDVDTEPHLSGFGAVRKHNFSIFLSTFCAAEGSVINFLTSTIAIYRERVGDNANSLALAAFSDEADGGGKLRNV